MTTKKKIILKLAAVLTCLIFSVTAVSAVSCTASKNTMEKTICGDKIANPPISVKSLPA